MTDCLACGGDGRKPGNCGDTVTCQACMGTGGVRVPCLSCKNGEAPHSHACPQCHGSGRTREHWEGVSGIMQYCVTHMAPRVWTGEDNCVYRASWKPSYPGLCDFQWMRYSFDVSEQGIADWIAR